MHVAHPILERFTIKPVAGDQPVLFAIPHAGAGAAVFANWRAELPKGIELAAVRMPGRERSVKLEPVTTFDESVDLIAEAIEAWGATKFAVLGQCSGALLAYEVTRALIRDGRRLPEHLFVVSQGPPGARALGKWSSELAGECFFDTVRNYGMLPEEMAFDSLWWRLIEPTLRADILAVSTYEWQGGIQIPCPVTAIVGTEDINLSRQDASEWRQYTSGAFSVESVEGGHLLASASVGRLVDCILRQWYVGGGGVRAAEAGLHETRLGRERRPGPVN